MPSSSPRLSPEQIAFFDTFGYLVLKGLLTPDEITAMNADFERAMTAQHPGDPFDGSGRHHAILLDEATPSFARMIEDPRFFEPAQQLYGEIIGIGVDGNRYVGDTGWHPDSADPHQYGIKFAIYLQPVRPASGALRVIPGSHRILPGSGGFAAGVQGMRLADVPSQALESDPGDVVAFDLRLWHASCGGRTDRRMCTAVYYIDPVTPEGIEALRRMGAQNVENMKHAGIGAARPFMYSAEWYANRRGSRLRQRWIDRLNEVGYFDAPNVVERPAHAS